MAELIYVVQRPGEGASILSAYRQLANGVAFDRLTAMFAFASFKGARLLTTAISESLPNWRRTRKRWVISVDGGITEPEALRFLLRLQRSEVRVPDGHEMLRRGLRPVNRFHPKTILLEAAEGAFRPVAIAVGSANLTCSGLCFGHEHTLLAGLDHLDGVPAGIAAGLESLHTMLESTPTIDEDFVDRYAAIRPARPSLPEEDRRSEHILQDRSVIAAVEAAALARASGLWVQVDYVVPNRGPNEEGNQIDLKRGTRVFFGFGDGALPRNSPIGSVRIRYGTHSAIRNIRFGNNQMDKLDLPVPDKEGPATYRNQTLLFTRESDGSFRLSVGSTAEAAAWKHTSERIGTLFGMQSGREYGVF